MKTLLFTLLIASAAFSQIEPKIDNAQEKVKDTAYVLFDAKYRKSEGDRVVCFFIKGFGYLIWKKKNKADTLSISFLNKISLASHETTKKKMEEENPIEKLYILERLNDRYLIRYPVKPVPLPDDDYDGYTEGLEDEDELDWK